MKQIGTMGLWCFLVVGCLGLSGCFTLGEAPTQGKNGRLEFTYTGGFFGSGTPGCFFGCSLHRAMVVGAEERVATRTIANPIPLNRVESSDTKVFEVVSFKHRATCCEETSSGQVCSSSTTCTGPTGHSYTFNLKAVGVGKADLILRAQDGSVLESVSLRVAKPERVEVQWRDWNNESSAVYRPYSNVTFSTDKSYSLMVKAYDKDGFTMQIGSAASLALSNPDVAAFETTILSKGTTSNLRQASAVLRCKTKGQLELSAKVGGLTQNVKIVVK